MATFVSTTLAKRTGATTTVFSPATIASNVGYLTAPGTYAQLVPQMSLKSIRAAGARRSTVRFVIPQVDTTNDIPLVGGRPAFEAVLYVPDGTLLSDVNDLVGYMHAALDSGKANINDILVNGIGVY